MVAGLNDLHHSLVGWMSKAMELVNRQKWIDQCPDSGWFPGCAIPDSNLNMALAKLGCLLQNLLEVGDDVVEVFRGRKPY